MSYVTFNSAYYQKSRSFCAGSKSSQLISCACARVCNKMANKESGKRKQNDYKALHEFSTADIHQVNEKKRYRPKSKIFQVERLLSKRKRGKVSMLFQSLSLADRVTSYLFSYIEYLR